jgi:hypothetical protein
VALVLIRKVAEVWPCLTVTVSSTLALWRSETKLTSIEFSGLA